MGYTMRALWSYTKTYDVHTIHYYWRQNHAKMHNLVPMYRGGYRPEIKCGKKVKFQLLSLIVGHWLSTCKQLTTSNGCSRWLVITWSVDFYLSWLQLVNLDCAWLTTFGPKLHTIVSIFGLRQFHLTAMGEAQSSHTAIWPEYFIKHDPSILVLMLPEASTLHIATLRVSRLFLCHQEPHPK